MRTRSVDAWLRIMIAEKSETSLSSRDIARVRDEQKLQALLTKRDIARELQLGPRTIDEWMRKGRIPFFKIGKTVRFRLADVLERLNAFRVN
jgi:excisionase family DNA binding protein